MLTSKPSFGWMNLCFLWAVAVAGWVGCEKGPPRYQVTGTVSFNGQPVPAGRIVFTPDRPKGNSGPQGVAAIEEGKIIPGHRNVVGGPHWMEIQCFDGVPYEGREVRVTYGRPLLPMQTIQVDLPRSDAELTVDIQEDSSKEYAVDVKVNE